MFKIDNTLIEETSPAYVIAEIGHNHQGDLEKCKEMFRSAKECGAHSVKLQKRNNKKIFTSKAYNQFYDNRNSYGETYGAHREFLEFDQEQFKELIDYANQLEITFFSTAFDFESADILEELNIPAYKIASFDITHTPLLEHIAKKGKPIILSTGGCEMDDIRRAYEAISPINSNLSILQCTSCYPSKFSELDLNVITTLKKEFPDIVVGFSGHDSGIAMAVAAYVLGAKIIEKHFTLNRANKGTDHAFSLEPIGLKKMCRDLSRCFEAMGDGTKKVYEAEIKPRMKMAKKIVAARDLENGHVLRPEDLDFRSPGDGMPPYQLDLLVGKALNRSISCEEPFSLDHV